MKKLILLFLVFVSLSARTLNDFSNCEYKGIKLYGRVMIVDAFEDLRVQEVEHAPDLRVQPVEYAPNSCGYWLFVEYHPDFKIRLVNHSPDIQVQFVEYSPGLN